MKRWKFKLAGAVLAIGGAVGCKQPLYMTEADRNDVIHIGSALLPKNLELDPSASMNVPTGEGSRTPRNVLNPDAPARNLSLAEAFSIALENGNEGSLALNGSSNGQLGSFAGNAFGGDDAIRAFALDPAVFGANIEASLSKFDTRWTSSMTWQKRDDAVTNVFNNLNNGDLATLNTGLFKPLPTGGLAGVTFNTDYTRLSSPPQGFQVVNPAYRPALTFQFEQPLLQNFGVEINQLLQQHPGSVQVAGLRPSGGTRTDGILITRIRYDQSRYEFQRRVNNMIVNVESAYWNLYSAYWNLYSAEQGMRQAYATYELTKALLEAGSRAKQELAQVEAQFEDFRVRRVQALQNVLTAERELRNLLGMKLEDGTRLVPSDAPTLSPYQPEWMSSLTEMLQARPELNLARQELKARQFDVILQKNSMRPDLRFLASYNVNGIGQKLDGDGSNALESLSDNKFNSWTLGFRLDVPLGTRDAHAAVRTSRLNLARSFVVLKNQERKAEFDLGSIYQQVFSTYERIRIQRAQREALARQLDGLVTRVKLGKDPLLVLLDAQRNFAAALAAEHQAIGEYNTAIARYQHSKGTILPYNNITISEGPLPNCVSTRAADHFRMREEALELRQRPGAILPNHTDPAGVPLIHGPVSLPTLLEGSPKVMSELPPVDPSKLPPGAVNPADPLGKYAMPGPAPSTVLPVPQVTPTMPLPLPTGTTSTPGLSGSAGASPNLPDPVMLPTSRPR
jgi:outer membrane protein TolC